MWNLFFCGNPPFPQVLLESFTDFLTVEQKCRKPANLSIVSSRFQRPGRQGGTKGTL